MFPEIFAGLCCLIHTLITMAPYIYIYLYNIAYLMILMVFEGFVQNGENGQKRAIFGGPQGGGPGGVPGGAAGFPGGGGPTSLFSGFLEGVFP